MNTLTAATEQEITPGRERLRALLISVSENGRLWDSEDGGAKLLANIAHALSILATGADWVGPQHVDSLMFSLSEAMGECENLGMADVKSDIGNLCPLLISERVTDPRAFR